MKTNINLKEILRLFLTLIIATIHWQKIFLLRTCWSNSHKTKIYSLSYYQVKQLKVCSFDHYLLNKPKQAY